MVLVLYPYAISETWLLWVAGFAQILVNNIKATAAAMTRVADHPKNR